MTHRWDEFSKWVAEPVPRRESLRRLGLALAGVVLSPLGRSTAVAAVDPCTSFCRCRTKSQQFACLAACRACNGNTRRLCGSCGSYVCCGNGQTCCGRICTHLANDVDNCGACGHVCPPSGLYEYGACINGRCVYQCTDGAVRCNGTCTFLGSDPNNCGACGHVCPGFAPYCNQGACSACAPGLVHCGNSCVNLGSDPNNCGACGNVCGGATPYCSSGTCSPCAGGGTFCNGICTNTSFDTLNCGGCGIVCAAGETCSGGVCQSPF